MITGIPCELLAVISVSLIIIVEYCARAAAGEVADRKRSRRELTSHQLRLRLTALISSTSPHALASSGDNSQHQRRTGLLEEEYPARAGPPRPRETRDLPALPHAWKPRVPRAGA